VDLSTALPLSLRLGWPLFALNFRSVERKPKGSSLGCSLGAGSTSSSSSCSDSGSRSIGREEGKGEVGIGEDGGKGDEAFNPAGCRMIAAERDCREVRVAVCCLRRQLDAGVDCRRIDSPGPSPGSPIRDCWESSNENPPILNPS